MKQILLSFLVVLLGLTCSLSLVNAQEEGDWQWFKSRDNIRSIDVHGEDVWIGMYKGVVRFNQNTKQVTKYTIFNSEINSTEVEDLVVDNEGKVWIGTYDAGLKTFDPSNDSWTTFNVSNSNIPSDSVYQVAKGNNGDIWLATEVGLSKYDGTSFINWEYDFPTVVSGNLREVLFDMLVDEQDRAWISSFTLLMYDHGDWYDFFEDDVFSYTKPSMILDDQQRVWFVGDLSARVSGPNQVVPLPEFNFQFHTITQSLDNKLYTSEGIDLFEIMDDDPISVNNPMPISEIPSYYTLLDYMFTDANGKPAMQCGNNLLFLDENNEWEYFNPLEEDLVSDHVLSLAASSNGDMWAGTWSGISIIGEDEWNNPLNFIGERVYSLLPENDGMWIGTQSQLMYRKSGQADQHVNFDLPSTVLDMQMTSTGEKWIQYDAGLHWFNDTDNEYFAASELPISGMWVQAFDVDVNDQVWIGDGFGNVSRRELNGTWSTFNSSNSPFNFHYTRDIYTDPNGHTWVSGFNYHSNTSYLYKYDGGNWEIIASNDLNFFAWGMIMNEAGELWVNNSHQVQKFDGQNWTTFDHKHIPSLSNNGGYVRTITLDHDDNLWVGATSGISILMENPVSTGVSENNITNRKIEVYPNPASSITNVLFELKTSEILSMYVYELSGRQVQTVFENQQLNEGEHRVSLHTDVPTGQYFIKLVGYESLGVIPFTIIE